MSKKLLIVNFLVFGTSSFLPAQNDLHFSHYMFNTVYYNPAAAGATSNLEANLVARKQWVGFNGAPTLGFLNAHTYLYKVRGGVGISLVNDKLGFQNITGLKGMYAYHLHLNEKHVLSAGLSMGFLYTSVDASKFILDNPNDNLANNVPRAKMAFDPNFGLEYNNKYVSVGVASTHILRGTQNATVFNMPRHYYVYVLGHYKVDDNWRLLPSLLSKSTDFITQLEISSLAQYKRLLWFGGTYRMAEAITAMAGCYINENFKIGYAYDFTGISKFRAYSSGTHELMISFISRNLDPKRYHIKTPRFFN